jgi:hypothetical protein
MGSGAAEEWLKGLDGRGKESRRECSKWEKWAASGTVGQMRSMLCPGRRHSVPFNGSAPLTSHPHQFQNSGGTKSPNQNRNALTLDAGNATPNSFQPYPRKSLSLFSKSTAFCSNVRKAHLQARNPGARVRIALSPAGPSLQTAPKEPRKKWRISKLLAVQRSNVEPYF